MKTKLKTRVIVLAQLNFPPVWPLPLPISNCGNETIKFDSLHYHQYYVRTIMEICVSFSWEVMEIGGYGR